MMTAALSYHPVRPIAVTPWLSHRFQGGSATAGSRREAKGSRQGSTCRDAAQSRCERAECMHFMTGRAAGSAAGHACALSGKQVMNDAAGVTPTALNLKQECGERAHAYAAI